MATSIATGALRPKVAVALSAVLNLVGAFLSLAVAAAIAKDLVDQSVITLPLIFCGLVGGITWNLLTWLLGLPVELVPRADRRHRRCHDRRRRHQWRALDRCRRQGGDPGADGPGDRRRRWPRIGTWLVYRTPDAGARRQPGAGLPLGPGRLGLAGLAGARHQRRPEDDGRDPAGADRLRQRRSRRRRAALGDRLLCASRSRSGTYIGGWRIIRTLGKGLVEIESPQGMAAESSSAAVILASSHFGLSLSTTHVATGSILGSGVGRRGATVRWAIAGRMVVGLAADPAGRRAWSVPSRSWSRTRSAGWPASPRCSLLMLVTAGAMWARARKAPVTSDNVNQEWADRSLRRPPSSPDAEEEPCRTHRPQGRRPGDRRRPAARRRTAAGLRGRAACPVGRSATASTRRRPQAGSWSPATRRRSRSRSSASRWSRPRSCSGIYLITHKS